MPFAYTTDAKSGLTLLTEVKSTFKSGIEAFLYNQQMEKRERLLQRASYKVITDYELFERTLTEQVAPKFGNLASPDIIQTVLGIGSKLPDIKFRNPAAVLLAYLYSIGTSLKTLASKAEEFKVPSFDILRYHRLLEDNGFVPKKEMSSKNCPVFDINKLYDEDEEKSSQDLELVNIIVDGKSYPIKKYPNDSQYTLDMKACQDAKVLYKYTEKTPEGIVSILKLFAKVTQSMGKIDVKLIWENTIKELTDPSTDKLKFGFEDEEQVQMIYLLYRLPFAKSFDKLQTNFNKYVSKLLELQSLEKVFKKELMKITYEKFAKEVNAQTETVQQFDNAFKVLMRPVSPDFSLTNIKQTLYTMEITFDVESIDIFEMFNKLKMSDEVPFAMLSRYVKTLNNANIPKDWFKVFNDINKDGPSKNTSENILYFYTRLSFMAEGSNNLKSEDYVLCSLTQINVEIIRDAQQISYRLEVTNRDETKDEALINQIVRAFQPLSDDTPKMDINKKFNTGLMVLSNYKIVPEIFYDFVMNNYVCSEVVIINEKDSIYKQKGGLKFQLRKNKYEAPIIKGAIKTVQVTSPKQIEMISFPSVVEINQFVTVIEIYGFSDIKDVEFLRENLLRVLYYIKHRTEIFFYDYYCHFIKDVRKEFITIEETKRKKKPEKDSEQLVSKQINPDLFVSGYNRNCSTRPYPNEYTEEQLDALIKEKVDFMVFPKTEEEGKQFIYTCKEYSKEKYVELVENKNLSNKEKYPLIPCCKVLPAKNDPTSKRYKYEHDIKAGQEKKKLITKEIKTNKSLKSAQFGPLPERVNTALNLTDPDVLIGKSQFKRYLPENVDSGDVLGLLTEITESNLDRTDLIDELRTLVKTQILAQSGITEEDGLRILDNKDYIDVQSWLPALELVFTTNIVIFCSNRTDNIAGSICPERHSRTLIMNPKTSLYPTTVFLFSHYGGEFEDYERPIVEVVVKKTGSAQVKYLFDTKTETVEKVRKLYLDMINVVYRSINLPRECKIVEQYPDGYGKIRELIVQAYGTRFKVYTEPIAPTVTQELRPVPVTLPSVELVKKILPNGKAVVFENQVIAVDDKTAGIYIPVKPFYTERLVDSRAPGQFMIPLAGRNQETFFKKYNKNVRIANYLNGYMFSLFSRHVDNIELAFAAGANTSSELDKKINIFSSRIVVDPSVNLENKKLIRLINMSVNAIPVPSMAVKQRLLYLLRMACMFRQKFVLEFKYAKYIPDFYTDARDFDTSPEFNVYNSLDEFLTIRKGAKPVYQTYVNLFDSDSPYFYQPTPDSDTYLVIPCKDQEEALKVISKKDVIVPNLAYTKYDSVLAEYVDINGGSDEVLIAKLPKKEAKKKEYYALIKYFV